MSPAPARATSALVVTLCTTVTLVPSASHLRVPSAPVMTIGSVHAAGYAEGAPLGFSGGFAEQSCHACHFHADVNAAPGRVTITGVPQRFVAGQRYPLAITLVRPGTKLAGFQLTARFKDTGAQAGTLAAAPGDEERIAIEVQAEIQYAGQRRQGTALASPDTARWALAWTAPTTIGPVVFHLAANAANADGTVEGDYIHTAVVDSASSEGPRAGHHMIAVSGPPRLSAGDAFHPLALSRLRQ